MALLSSPVGGRLEAGTRPPFRVLLQVDKDGQEGVGVERRFGIMREGEVADIFLSRHAMGWWVRVSTEAVLVGKRIFGGRKNGM